MAIVAVPLLCGRVINKAKQPKRAAQAIESLQTVAVERENQQLLRIG